MSQTRTDASLAIAPALALACVLVSLGWPLPHRDDLFWLGTAIGLETHGELVNPYIQAYLDHFGSQHVLFYPPLFFATLAAWLHMFGVSTASLVLFHWTVLAGAVSGLVALLRSLGLSLPIRALAGLLLTWQGAQSLRPEPLAYALAFWGLSLWCRTRPPAVRLAGSLLWWLSLIAYPVTLACAPLLLVLGQRDRHGAAPGFRSLILPGVLTMVPAAMAFMVLIKFRIQEFWALFSAARALRAAQTLAAPKAFLGALTLYREWLFTAPLFLVFLALVVTTFVRPSAFPATLRHLLAAVSVVLSLTVLMYAERAPFGLGMVFVFAAALAAAEAKVKRIRSPTLFTLGLLWLVWAHAHPIVALVVQRPPDPANIASVASQLRATAGAIYMDGAVARYVFDYRLPPGAASLFFGVAPPPGVAALPDYPKDLSWKGPADTWAASATTLSWIAGTPAEETATLLGWRLRSIPLRPLKLVVLASDPDRR